MYAVINNEATLNAALTLCRGCYQRNILLGREALSGATLRGRAKSYSDRYARSARNLLARCQRAGLAVRASVGSHNKRTVVIG